MQSAISNLEQVMQMDEGYQDGQAMLLLAQSYEKSGDQDKANLRYQQILEDHKDTDAATDAQEALDAQKTKKADGEDEQDAEDGSQGET